MLWRRALPALLTAALALSGCSDDETFAPATTSVGGSGGQGGQGGAGATGGASPACQQLADQAQLALEQTLSGTSRSGGTAAAMITPECGLWESAVGEAGDAVDLTAAHLLRVGSVTKTYVAATVLLLAAEAALSLDDYLEDYVAGVPNGPQITIRQLLNHTAGVYNYTEDGTFMAQASSDPTVAYTPQQIIDVAISHGASFAPGTSWEYSNTGYVLLGMIIESVTGEAAGAAIRSRVIDPTALSATFLDGEEALVGELATGYSALGSDVTVALHPSVPWTAGSMVAAIGDVARWGAALYRGAVLAPPQMTDMLSGVDTGSGMQYGLGVTILGPPSVEGAAYGHGGSINGYHSQLLYFVELDSTIATIVNSDAGDPNDATAALYTLLLNR